MRIVNSQMIGGLVVIVISVTVVYDAKIIAIVIV